jgi:hypothetical protein
MQSFKSVCVCVCVGGGGARCTQPPGRSRRLRITVSWARAAGGLLLGGQGGNVLEALQPSPQLVQSEPVNTPPPGPSPSSHLTSSAYQGLRSLYLDQVRSPGLRQQPKLTVSPPPLLLS